MADVDDVLAVLKRQPSKVRGGHSPVYLWLWRHHEHLKGELTLPRRMNWSALADELGRRGIMDGDGKPPTAERTRKAWWQVGRDKEAAAEGQAGAGCPLAASQRRSSRRKRSAPAWHQAGRDGPARTPVSVSAGWWSQGLGQRRTQTRVEVGFPAQTTWYVGARFDSLEGNCAWPNLMERRYKD